MKQSKRVALSGVLAALAVVILFLGTVIDVLDLSASALAALVVMVAVVDMGNGWATGVYATAAVLGVLLMPRTASVLFASFVGYYPIIKVYLDRIRPKVLQYACKLVLFNGFLALTLWLSKKFLGAENGWQELGKWLYILGNVTFVLFDFAIGQLSVFYIVKIRSRISRGH